MITRILAGVLLTVQLGGCYAYTATGTPPVPGEAVRARLTPAGTVWLAQNFGRNRDALDGTFVREDPAGIVFSTWRADLPGRTDFRTSIDTLRIPREHVAALEERRLSIGRTAVAAAAATGIIILAISAINGAGGDDDDNGGGTPFLVLPLRVPFAR